MCVCAELMGLPSRLAPFYEDLDMYQARGSTACLDFVILNSLVDGSAFEFWWVRY